MNDTLDLRKKKKEEIYQILKDKKYDKLDDNYNYLLKMHMDSVTSENVESLIKQYNNIETQLNTVKNTTVEQMWINELNKLKDTIQKETL